MAGLYIRPTKTAVQHRHIQPNAPLEVSWLVFDLDYAGAALAWEVADLPPPTVIAVNPENAHAHLFYGLTIPICMSDAARDAPIRYGAAVQASYLAKLKADPGYAGLIAKNPLHPGWKVLWVNKLYDLGELAEYVTLSKRLHRPAEQGLGRNCMLFDELRAWAYSWVRTYKKNGASSEEWGNTVLAQAERLNTFDILLDFSEVKAIAKSVGKWTWRQFNEASFSAIQSARGKRGGRPKTTTKDGRPWDDTGISRATYYRRLERGLLLPE